MLTFILILASTDVIHKNLDNKLDMFITGNSGFVKIAFALLSKSIAI